MEKVSACGPEAYVSFLKGRIPSLQQAAKNHIQSGHIPFRNTL